MIARLSQLKIGVWSKKFFVFAVAQSLAVDPCRHWLHLRIGFVWFRVAALVDGRTLGLLAISRVLAS